MANEVLGAQIDVEEHLLEYVRPTLYPKQFQAIFDPRRYSLIEASTKSGKTAGCIVWLIEKGLAGKDGQNFWWVAPVSGQADIAFRRAMRALPPDLAAVNITLKTITLANGAVIWFKSADKPDSLYGEDVYAAVIDEASRVKEDAYYAVRSTLTATRGPIRIIGNVKGRKNWFFRLARRAQQEANDLGRESAYGYHKLTAYDAVNAKVLEADEIADAKKNLPERVFRELYMAEASDDEGNPFGFVAIKQCVGVLSNEQPVCWGWDLAKHQDWTVGIGLDQYGRTCRFSRWQKVPWDQTIERIKRETGKTPALIDSTGVGDPILDLLQKNGGTNFEGYVFSPPSKQKLMEGLAVAIQSTSVRYPGGVIEDELEQFEYVYTRTGVRYSAPEGYFDDCVMSLALAVEHKGHARAPVNFSSSVMQKLASTPPPPRNRNGRRR